MTTKQWKRELLNLAMEIGFTDLRIVYSASNQLKLYSCGKLICTASCTPSDPNVKWQYRRQLRQVFKKAG